MKMLKRDQRTRQEKANNFVRKWLNEKKMENSETLFRPFIFIVNLYANFGKEKKNKRSLFWPHKWPTN